MKDCSLGKGSVGELVYVVERSVMADEKIVPEYGPTAIVAERDVYEETAGH